MTKQFHLYKCLLHTNHVQYSQICEKKLCDSKKSAHFVLLKKSRSLLNHPRILTHMNKRFVLSLRNPASPRGLLLAVDVRKCKYACLLNFPFRNFNASASLWLLYRQNKSISNSSICVIQVGYEGLRPLSVLLRIFGGKLFFLVRFIQRRHAPLLCVLKAAKT